MSIRFFSSVTRSLPLVFLAATSAAQSGPASPPAPKTQMEQIQEQMRHYRSDVTELPLCNRF